MYASLIVKPSIVNNAIFKSKGHPKKVLRHFIEFLLAAGLVKKEEIIRWVKNAGTTNPS